MKNKYKDETSGRSMVEIIGALAVMSLISAGAMVLVRSGSASQKRSRTFDEVMAIVENVRMMYPDGFADMGGFESNRDLIDALDLNATTPFGPDTFYSVRAEGANQFHVLISGLDNDDCTVLAAQTWPDALNASCSRYYGASAVYLLFGA